MSKQEEVKLLLTTPEAYFDPEYGIEYFPQTFKGLTKTNWYKDLIRLVNDMCQTAGIDYV